MRRYWLHLLLVGGLALLSVGHSGRSTGNVVPNAPPPKFPDFDTLVKGAKEYDGLFKLYQKDETLFAELRPHQFDQPFLCPIAVARGMGEGGHTRNFGEQWVLVFQRVGDRVFLVRRNVRFRARPSTPVARAVETSYVDSVLMALRIHSIHPIRQGVLISLNDIFMTDFAQLRRGMFDPNRSTWHKVKAFPRNIELQVAATYAGGGQGDAVIDSRGATVVIHYGLCQLPDAGYQPRLADDRVGHFISVVKDYTTDTRDTPFLRYVNRWRLERADGSVWKEGGKLAPPKKKIVFWIEKSVPDEYRGYVRDGILEWNKAFAKVGFRDAIEVRQQENEEFDPEDSNYNTFRWITTDRGYAMGPSRANPLTGELFDADIVFDASMVRYYRQSASLYGGAGAAIAEDISPIRAQQKGLGLSALEMGGDDVGGWDTRPAGKLDLFAKARFRAVASGLCECGPCLKRELNLLALAVALRDDGAAPPPAAGSVLNEELIGQAIKEVTMHEVGHTLGLRHNFKSSTMLKNEQLHDTAITRTKGLVGSVMDYAPINLAPKGVKQGDYFTTTLGPYDYWVIDYAYRPLSGTTESEYEELKKIASKAALPGHDYATDEDLYATSDPFVNTWDLGADPMKFAQDRILLAEELLAKLADKGASKGEGYQRVRQAFGLLLREYGNGAFLIAKFVGGVAMHRDHDGDPNARDPFIVVDPDKQRAALKFLQEHILTDRPFRYSPKLLRRLASDRWVHWGAERNLFSEVDYPIHERILEIQQVVLQHALDGSTLARVQNNALKADKDAKNQPLQVAEVFRGITDAVWADPLRPGANGKRQAELSVVTRNLQREHLRTLAQLVLRGGDAPADARSLARLHLREVGKRIDRLVGDGNVTIDDTSRAHLEESRERIAKTLNASLQTSEP
ncbi:MAG: zinc-dependent metalloprotease [Gemmataceae bacterium]